MHQTYLIIFASSLLTIGIVQKLSITFSDKYFSIIRIVESNFQDFSYKGSLIIFFPPLLVSIALTNFILESKDGHIYILVYGFLSSFLNIWPILINPKGALTSRIYKQKNKLLLLYFIYVCFYELICLMAYYSLSYKDGLIYSNILTNYLRLDLMQQGIVASTISTMICGLFCAMCSYLYKLLNKWYTTQI